MERDSEFDPVVDMTAPGSDTDQADGSASQISFEDSLEAHVTADVLDEGYSPPDFPPAVDVPTPAEERAGEGLARRLAEEEPESGAGEVGGDERDDDDAEFGRDQQDGGAGGRRSGRLMVDDDGRDHAAGMAADDAGIAGGSASAEEAAVHLLADD